jgi:hypothetical protein
MIFVAGSSRQEAVVAQMDRPVRVDHVLDWNVAQDAPSHWRHITRLSNRSVL